MADGRRGEGERQSRVSSPSKESASCLFCGRAAPTRCLNAEPMMRYILSFLTLATLSFGQTPPSITSVTNAALPPVDQPPSSYPVVLTPRSVATVFGDHLADAT